MLLVSVYLIILFHLIVVSFSSICVFISLCRIRCPYPCLHAWGVFRRLLGCLSCVACRGAFYVVASSLFLLFVILFVFSFSCLSVSCPFSSVCFPCLSPNNVLTPGLIWFCSVYLMTTAGFVADQLIIM